MRKDQRKKEVERKEFHLISRKNRNNIKKKNIKRRKIQPSFLANHYDIAKDNPSSSYAYSQHKRTVKTFLTEQLAT